ncbi:hypothetical protein EV193_101551 [Herbihabitans rhizosphaerae]|uniref:WD40 repeat protein n=1 Tax=Herbihabitans rhizosphaerae TaxID=1872711 RepID=A0A4Q7L5Q9_9PSEU|nr:hypothetical protein [Herbihabitans rhizosphaerae]RZS44675.1 hypothetical protein EV193_101551 [Herbihabitans rhizosphaerae]
MIRHRVAVGVIAIVAVVLFGIGYVVWTMSDRDAAAAPGTASGHAFSFVDFADGRTRVDRLGPDGARSVGSLRCQRFYSAGGTSVCLRLSGVGPSYSADVLDAGGTVVRSVPLPGVPSRVRVSASGKIVSWTVFVTGDSYLAPGGFSTRTGYLDLRTGTLVESLEDFSSIVDGRPERRVDFNYWGMTVSSDDRTFYATLGSGQQNWLVRGDLATRSVTTIRPGVECPSLSPDGTRIAFKQRGGRLGAWQLNVLDLRSGNVITLPGTGGVDDQAAWLDDRTLAYAKVPQASAPAIYTSPADGSGEPRLVIGSAASPSPG